MKTKTLNSKKIAMIGIMALFFALLLFPTFKVKAEGNGYQINIYNNKQYKGKEESAELEKILRADGYICISSWCSDDEELTELFKNSEGLFIAYDFIDYNGMKCFVSPETITSVKQGGFDNMDTVLIDVYAISDEAQNLEGKIAINYTTNPVPVGTEKCGTVTIKSTVNDEILKKYAYTKATLIFTSYDTNKSFEIDLNAANGFSDMVTVMDGNYYIKSIFLGEDCVPYYETSDFTVASEYGANPILEFDFTANWDKKNAVGNRTENSSEEEVQTLQGTEVTKIEEDVKEKNWMPTIATVSSFLLLAIIGLVIYLVIKKKSNSGSM